MIFAFARGGLLPFYLLDHFVKRAAIAMVLCNVLEHVLRSNLSLDDNLLDEVVLHRKIEIGLWRIILGHAQDGAVFLRVGDSLFQIEYEEILTPL